MKSILFQLLFCLAALHTITSHAQSAQSPLQPHKIELSAEFANNTRCPVFKESEPVSLKIKASGRRASDDNLSWNLADLDGTPFGKGEMPVPKGDAPWEGILNLPKTPYGYFEVYLKLHKAGITIPQTGTRPEGFVTFAVMPKIERAALPSTDASRFGGQGTNFIKSGEFMKGDYVDPVYPLTGMKWIYRNRRPAELYPSGPDSFVPALDPDKVREQGKWSCEKAAGLCLFIDAHSIPGWLTKYPDGVKPPAKVSPTNDGQSYPPNDFVKYGQMIGKIAAEQALNRKINFPGQKKNYYEIHWEPDWHWKGGDEDFIKMYEAAYRAIHENDPEGMLLGANYGVLSTGNKHLERLFEKGLGKYLDGIVTHTYFIPEYQAPEKGHLSQDMRKLVALTRKHLKPGSLIINSEWGVNNGSYPSLKYHWALKDEAARFMRGHLTVIGEGADTTFFFYTADCGLGGGGLFFNLTYPNPVFGATNIAPKPVGIAAAVATRLLEGSRSLGALEYLGDNVYGYAFDRGGVIVAALWTTDAEEKEIVLPAGAKEVISYDPMGNSRALACKNGYASLKVGAIPSYISGISKGAIPSVALKLSGRNILPGGDLIMTNHDPSKNIKYQMFSEKNTVDLGAGPKLNIPRSASSGTWLISAVDGKTGEWLGSTTVEITQSVSMDMPNIGTFKLANTREEAIKGVFTIIPENGKPVFNKDIEIPAKSSVSVDTPSALISLVQATMLNLRFTDSFSSMSKNRLELPSSYMARKVQSPPSINGSLDDWQLELFQTVSGQDRLKINHEGVFGGDADLSFRFAIQYDENALYIALKVRDDSHCQELWDADSWKEDSMQVGIALHPEGGDWKFFHKFCFALSTKVKDGVMGFRHNGTPEFPPGKPTQDIVRHSVKREGDETNYEIAIPWNSMEKSLKTFPDEKIIGLGIFVNDVDVVNGVKGKRKAMEAFGGMGYTLPKDFGKVMLK